MSWTFIVIGVSVLAALLLGYQEYRRLNKSKLWLRILSVNVAITALACIVLPVNYYSSSSHGNDHEAILLTRDFEKDSLVKDANTFTLDSSINREYKTARLVSSVEDLLLTDSTVTSLRILGDGLNQSQLSQLGEMPVSFNPSKNKTGLQSISWNGQVQAGNTLRVQGKFLNALAGNVDLILKGLNTTLDSVTVKSGSSLNFELNTVPKNEGRVVYHLLAISGKDTVEKEDLPVEVSLSKPLRLLVLNSSPDFETRFIKNWLTAKGYVAVIRSAISKNKYSTEFVNTAEQPITQISIPLLQKFDVVMGDLSALKALNPSESASLKEEVVQKGLGLIVRADSSGKENSWLQAGFTLEKGLVKSVPVSMAIRGKKNLSARLTTDAPYLISKGTSQLLVSDRHDHQFAGSTLIGNGKIVYTSLNNTFNWMLAGDEADYSALWSLLITEASRKLPETEKWSVISPIPVKGQKTVLQLQSSSAPAQMLAGNMTIAPVQNAVIPFEWDTELWPSQPGWQQVSQQGRPVKWWYAWSKDSWGSIIALKNRYETKLYAEKHSLKASVTKQIQSVVLVPVPKIYFYILFLLAGIFLWVEHKLSE